MPKEKKSTSAFSSLYSKYVLGVLLVVYIFNFIDRQILTILAEPIKRELGISDGALGFLTGTAFALFYATMGIPIARLADRTSRRSIIACALVLWSGMTALCGTATAFWQLAAYRIGVAVGEAGGSPPAHSMISDMFKPDKRATALAVYSMGIPVGGMIGLMVGGYISEAYDWRIAFLLVGIPGIALALLVRLSVREPMRGAMEANRQTTEDAPELMDVFRALRKQKSFLHLSLGAAFTAFAGYGLAAFNAPYFERMWDLSRTEIGWYLGLISGISGMAGVFAGGYLGDLLARRDRRWYMWLCALSMLISLPFYFGVYTSASWQLALIFIIVPSFMGVLYTGPTFSMVQGLVPLRMRAVAAAILLFILNIIGLGLGPQLVGILSDVLNWLVTDGDDSESLRIALLSASMVKIWAALHFYLASRTLRHDLDSMQSPAPQTTGH